MKNGTHRRDVAALVAAGWSLERIAVRLDKTESAIRSWRDGRSVPRPKVRAALARLAESVRRAEDLITEVRR